MTPEERAVYCANAADAQRAYWELASAEKRAAHGAAIAAGLKAAKAERARHAAFGKPRKNKAAWADPALRARQSAIVKAAWEKRRDKADVAYDFKHLRAKAAPDAIPAIPSLGAALGAE